MYANFVSSLGGVAAGGEISSGAISLAKPADRFVMGLLRACASAVLIGAGTLRPEAAHRWTPEYIYPQAADDFAELRRSLGLTPMPPLAVVTASGRLPSLQALTPGSLIITTSSGAAALGGNVPDSTEVVVASAGESVAAADIVAALRHRGHARILTEGGPRLSGDLLAGGLVDELFLTLSPVVFGGAPPATGIFGQLSLATEPRFRATLLSARRAGSHLLLRYAFGSPRPEDGPEDGPDDRPDDRPER